MHLLLAPFIFFCMLLCQPKASQPECKARPVLLMNATAHLGNGQTIDNAAVAFQKGKLTLVGDATRIRLDMSAFEVIHVYRKHLYPAVVAEKDSLPAHDSLYFVSADSLRLVVGFSHHRLEEGTEASLVVTNRPIGEGSHPEVVMAFIRGKKVTPQNKYLKLLK